MRRVTEGTSALLSQSGLNESWWTDSKECYTYLRNVTVLLSDGKKNSTREQHDDLEGRYISWCIFLGIGFYRHHIQARVELYVPKESSFPFPIMFFDVVRWRNTTVDVLQERSMTVVTSIVGTIKAVDWMHPVLVVEWNPIRRGTWSESERLPQIRAASRPEYVWPTGNQISRAEIFGDLMTADHNVPNEECVSRNGHRYAVIVQVSATQWLKAWSGGQSHVLLLTPGQRRRRSKIVCKAEYSYLLSCQGYLQYWHEFVFNIVFAGLVIIKARIRTKWRICPRRLGLEHQK